MPTRLSFMSHAVSRKTVPFVLACALIAGCQAQKPKPGPTTRPVNMAQRVAEVRARFQQIQPGTMVGLVVTTDAQRKNAAVGDVPTSDFKDGDLISFLDADENLVNHGTVIKTYPDNVIVNWGDGKRDPRPGDMAVRLPPSPVVIQQR